LDIVDDMLLRPKEVAAAFRVTTRTLQRWERAGLLRSERTLGGHRRYWRSDVQRALTRGSQMGN
jgi:excisionase family DNA binding protein